ncbi:MAG: hypothetical protein ACLFPX_05540 [Candidatus Omnitrophota bacterium]
MIKDDRNKFRQEIRQLCDFVAEQVIAGLFKSDIIDKLIEMGISREQAADLLEEMECRLKNLRKRRVMILSCRAGDAESVQREFTLCGYTTRVVDIQDTLEQDIEEFVPDLIVLIGEAPQALSCLQAVREDIIGRAVPVYVGLQRKHTAEVFQGWDHVRAFMPGYHPADLSGAAREMFLRKSSGT